MQMQPSPTQSRTDDLPFPPMTEPPSIRGAYQEYGVRQFYAAEWGWTLHPEYVQERVRCRLYHHTLQYLGF
jgi:hypothetical protein